MTTYLGKSYSFGLPRVPFVNCRQFVYLVFGFEGSIWNLIVSVPDHWLSFYFVQSSKLNRQNITLFAQVRILIFSGVHRSLSVGTKKTGFQCYIDKIKI